ncbi:MAG: copper homeostasis protein CutC [Saprospiraceae bacterium]
MPVLEICVTNIQSAVAAQQGGAHRVELCAALDSGGLTPSAGLIRAVRGYLDIPVNVLIRPREGNFCYTDAELAIMLADIDFCRQSGASGVVIGVLDAASRLDVPKMQALLAAASGMDITFHRAFDFVPDPFEALDVLIKLGVSRVLSSGQAASAHEGRFLLKKMAEYAAGRISVMPGAGLSAQNIRAVAAATGAWEFHLSAKKKVIQTGAASEIPGLEWQYWESEEAQVRETSAILALLPGGSHF